MLIQSLTRAIEALARPRGIAPVEAREWMTLRLLEMPVDECSCAKVQTRPTGPLPRLKRLFVNGPVIGVAAMWGK